MSQQSLQLARKSGPRGAGWLADSRRCYSDAGSGVGLPLSAARRCPARLPAPEESREEALQGGQTMQLRFWR